MEHYLDPWNMNMTRWPFFLHMQQELSQANLQQEVHSALTEVQASLKEKWAQESAPLQAQQQLELDHIREQSREQWESLHELHQRDMGEIFF